MANSYFQFKKFRIDQGHSAMKVGTDGVILGAWCSVPHTGACPSKILDVGCGTGLIALMVAQRCASALIEAIDIDEGAVRDAAYNFGQSPWSDRLKCCNVSLQDFAADTVMSSHSNIISNPPFFVNSLQAPDMARNMARHALSLSYGDLLVGVSLMLAEDGVFSVILPADNYAGFEELAPGYGLHCFRRLNVIPKPDAPVKRVAMEFCRQKRDVSVEDLIIESGGRHQYSNGYKNLTADFYLKF